MSLGIKSFATQGVHDGFLDSRWVPEFTMGPLAEDLMPRDIMSSEPRHWMVFG